METVEKSTNGTEFVKQFEDYLKSCGLRLTQKRLDVLNQVFDYPGHFQTEDLLVQMRRNGYLVSRPTIYRTLPLLVQSGLLTEFIDAQKNTRYESIHSLREHAHLICLRCNQIVEFKEPQIDALQKAVCEAHDFKAVRFRNEIIGYCAECQAEIEPKTSDESAETPTA
ncbi:transcriptional repressor [Candidatus Poribacteria bacterium]|nr:MAG: transcriptional repressor [Candidatus Poribacteria bacterium]